MKPEFWANDKLSQLPEVTHMAAAALLNYADDDGYFNANPGLVKAAIFPLREPSQTIPVILSELSEVGYLRLGTGADGRRYGHIVKFLDHQSISKKSNSKIKPLEIFWEDAESLPELLPESSRPEQGTGNGTGNGNRDQGNGTAALIELQPDPIAKIVAQLPLVDGTEYAVTERDIDEWKLAFPAVDVLQQLRQMRVWCNANKPNRKTRSGVLRFVSKWLGKAQNDARPGAARGGGQSVAERNSALREEMHREVES